MNKFKGKLDRMMGDTSNQERRIKQHVHEKLQTPSKKVPWQVRFATVAFPAIALLLIITFIPAQLFSSEKGRGVPYDPLDDLAKISSLQKNNQLSDIDYDEFSALPYFDRVEGLHYVDKETFSLPGSQEIFHTVIERKDKLFDEVIYQSGDIVRTMTNTTSHLPTYDNVYYEVVAVPGDRVMLKDGKLRINGKTVSSEIMEQYKDQKVTIAGGYDQVLNAREYFLLNHFPARDTVQGATITPVHKILGQVAGIATENETESIYLDYVTGRLADNYSAEQYFDLYLYDALSGFGQMPQAPVVSQITRVDELFLEASYRKVVSTSDNRAEVRYQYGREGVANRIFTMERDPQTGHWLIVN